MAKKKLKYKVDQPAVPAGRLQNTFTANLQRFKDQAAKQPKPAKDQSSAAGE